MAFKGGLVGAIIGFVIPLCFWLLSISSVGCFFPPIGMVAPHLPGCTALTTGLFFLSVLFFIVPIVIGFVLGMIIGKIIEKVRMK